MNQHKKLVFPTVKEQLNCEFAAGKPEKKKGRTSGGYLDIRGLEEDEEAISDDNSR